jgi:hypothetical protein
MNAYQTADSVEHLVAEHRRLHVVIRLAGSAIFHCGGAARNRNPADILQVLQNVREELAHHFAEEEAGNCFEEIAGHCTTLLAQARRIRTEHPELIRGIDKLIAQVADDRRTLEDRIAIEREFDCLCEQLFEHEAAENDLLRQALASAPRGAVEVPALC